MNRFRGVFSIYLVIGFMIFGLAVQAKGQVRRNEREVRGVLRSLNSNISDFKYDLNRESSRNSASRRDNNDIKNYLNRMENSIGEFQAQFQRRRETAEYVSEILDPAKGVNDIVLRRNFNAKLRRDWMSIRALLDRLAANYSLGWSWDDGNSSYPNSNNYPNNYPSTRSNSYNNSLTGTYQLDVSRSDNTRDIADRAIRNSNARNSGADNQRDLESKLDAPEQIAIDLRGNQVTLSSSKAPAITFAADGRDRTEKLNDGRTLRVRGTLRGQELTVSSLGGDTDYTVVFASIDSGNSMRVTRRITTEYLRQTVFAESVYNKTDQVARLGIDNNSNDSYSSNDPQDNRSYPNNYPNNSPRTSTGRTGQFIVPNGTILTGTLENEINTKASQTGDRFRMTVNAPNQYRGAIVEGYLSGINRSGKVSGRSQITFNFERITLSNGQTYDFAGFLQSVTDANGKTVQVDTEGTARGDNQTKETVKRGGIGAGLGAIIGAIAGGAKGAAIGAIIGGGAGAGSVVLQGKEDLELRAGSSITVQASSSIR